MRKDIYERIQIMKKDNIKPKFSEMARIYNCDYCGLVIDRDYNSAINLANYIK